MGAKIAAALGCHVTVLSRSPAKKTLALDECKANQYLCTGPMYKDTYEKAYGTIDLILNTIPTNHDYTFFLPFLAPKGMREVL